MLNIAVLNIKCYNYKPLIVSIHSEKQSQRQISWKELKHGPGDQLRRLTQSSLKYETHGGTGQMLQLFWLLNSAREEGF